MPRLIARRSGSRTKLTTAPRVALLCAALSCVASASAADQGAAPASTSAHDSLSLSPSELADLAAQLGLASGARREAALAELLGLGDQDLPSIRQRLRVLASGKSDHKPWLSKLPTLRRTRAILASHDDQTVGLLAALEQDRSPAMVSVVELFALLRALESQHSVEASELIVVELFALEPLLFRSELARDRKRLGKLLVPGLLRARAQGSPALQKLSREALSALGMSSDASLFGQSDPELLAAIVRTTSELRSSEALPWFVGLLDDARPAVRAAARGAVAAHVPAALDLLRQRMADLIGEEPDPSWDAAHLLTRLLQHVDAAGDRATVEALQQAQPGLRSGDLATVAQKLDAALASGTSPATEALAAASYLELGARHDRRNETERALTAYRRALRLSRSGSDDARMARARVLYLEAEQRAGRGIADLHTLQAVTQLEPGESDAAALLEELRGLRVDRERELQKRLGFAAVAMLVIAALMLLGIRARGRREHSLLAVAGRARTTKSPST